MVLKSYFSMKFVNCISYVLLFCRLKIYESMEIFLDKFQQVFTLPLVQYWNKIQIRPTIWKKMWWTSITCVNALLSVLRLTSSQLKSWVKHIDLNVWPIVLHFSNILQKVQKPPSVCLATQPTQVWSHLPSWCPAFWICTGRGGVLSWLCCGAARTGGLD